MYAVHTLLCHGRRAMSQQLPCLGGEHRNRAAQCVYSRKDRP
jgi:hypothetical protein